MFLPEAQKAYATEWQRNASGGLIDEVWLLRLLENFQLFSYQMIHRMTLLQFWLFALLPMCIAIVATGYYHWRIKQYQMGGSSVNYVRGYMKLMWLTMLVLCVYLITPNLFGPYTIYAPAFLLLTIATTLSLVFSNYSK
jgi:cobalamin synthase